MVGAKIQIKEGSDIQEFDLDVNKTEMKWSYDETVNGVKYKYTIVFKKHDSSAGEENLVFLESGKF